MKFGILKINPYLALTKKRFRAVRGDGCIYWKNCLGV